MGVRRAASLTIGLLAGACGFDASGVGSSGATLGSADTTTTTGSSAWNAIEVEGLAPPSTRLVQVQLRCTRKGGEYCDGYFDDVSLVAIYE